jgi:hypothetical protein
VVLVKVGDSWFLEYSRNGLARASTTQTVEYSGNLKNWKSINIQTDTSGAVEITPGSSLDLIRVAIPAEIGAPTFARLKVTE